MNPIFQSINIQHLEKGFERSALLFRPTKAAVQSTAIKSYGCCKRKRKTVVEEYCEPKFKGNQRPIGKGSYHIVFASIEDRPEIKNFLTKTFMVDEPLTRSSCLGSKGSKDLHDYLLESLPDNLSLMAVSSTGKPVGVAINANYGPTDKAAHNNLKKIKCRTTLDLMKLWNKVEREANLFARWPVSHIFELRVLATCREVRGMGVARALMDRSRELAEELGYPLMRIDCSSHYSALASEGLGFTCVYQLDYKDYKDAEGKPVFVVAPPHDKLKVYTRVLEY